MDLLSRQHNTTARKGQAAPRGASTHRAAFFLFGFIIIPTAAAIVATECGVHWLLGLGMIGGSIIQEDR